MQQQQQAKLQHKRQQQQQQQLNVRANRSNFASAPNNTLAYTQTLTDGLFKHARKQFIERARNSNSNFDALMWKQQQRIKKKKFEEKKTKQKEDKRAKVLVVECQ